MQSSTEAARTIPAPQVRGRGVGIAVTAAVIAVLAWPTRLAFAPVWGGNYFSWGLDFSWAVALHLAAIHDLHWGREVVFTYGPLGFLVVPMLISPWTSGLGLAFVALLLTSLAATSLLAFRRLLPFPLAALAAFALVVLAGAPLGEAGAFSGLLLVGLALGGALSPPATRLVPPLVAGLAAVLLLVKVGSGVVLAATVPLALLAEPRDLVRRALVSAGVFLAVLACAWLAAGQSLADFPPWLRAALAATAGYTEAMAKEQPARRWEYFGFAAMLVALFAGLALGTDRRRVVPLLALAAVLGIASLMFMKSGFVRHDGPGHSTILFSFLAIAPLLVPWRGRWRAAGIALIAAASVMLFVVREVPLRSLFDVRAHVRTLVHQITTVSDAEASRAMQDSARAKLRELVALPPAILAEIEGRRVHVDPHDVTIAWAYDLDWTPAPVFQSYAAYTPSLDRRNAERLADADGPERILRRGYAAIDERYALWETPAYALARLCRYREVMASDLWQVLERGADRCGAEHVIGTATLQPGTPLAVPSASAPDRIVVARLTERVPLLERLRATLFKPAGWLDRVANGRRERLIRANLGGPLLLRIPASSGWDPRFDGGLATAAFAIEGSDRPFEVTFAEIPLAP